MKLPNFLMIGIQKAGTTSIYNYLNQHPQVYMSPVKETNFLERNWEALPQEQRQPGKIDSFEKYCNLFAGVKEEIAIGEASPNYLFHYQASCERIQRYVPDVKMFAILRNPAERAYSDYIMRVRDARVKKSLSEQIKSSSNKSFLILKGFYYTPVKYYFDQFGKERIKIYLYDDLCREPGKMMEDLYNFIGVDSNFSPDMSQKSQTGAVPKLKFWNNLLQQENPLRSVVRSLVKPIIGTAGRQKIRSQLIKINLETKSKTDFSTEDRHQLIKIYREDILKLQDLIERDLSSWLKE